MGVLIWFVTFLQILVSSSAANCDRCVHRSKAAISDYDFMKTGDCQYGGDKTEFNSDHLAGARQSIYKQGAGCGALYQVRCTNETICNVRGIEVIVTTKASETNDDNADFMFSKEAFKELFTKNKVPKLDKILVEYKRVESVYGEKKPMSIRVEDMDPNHNFIIKLLYQGGQTYVTSIAMAFKNPKNKWNQMTRRDAGATWEVAKTIKKGCQLKFKFTVIEGFEYKDYETDIFVTIEQKGVVYGLGLQLDGKIAKEKCKTCDKTSWR